MKDLAFRAQRRELTEYHVYKNLSKRVKNPHNRRVLEQISRVEFRHHDVWARITGKKASPEFFALLFYTFVSSLLGLSFGLKLMERREKRNEAFYRHIYTHFPSTIRMLRTEAVEEKKLLNRLKEERLEYISAIVLGLNDAIVEITGALAGLTFALREGRIVAVSGLIMGFAASLSMAASSYLSFREEKTLKPLKAAAYTGITYFVAVIFLVLPYLLMSNVFVALLWTIAIVLLLILAYSFYVATAKSLSFLEKLREMAFVSLSVAILSFVVGTLLRIFVGV